MKGEGQPPDAPPPEGEERQAQENDEVALLGEQLEEALREKDQFRTMAQRAQADLANYKRRAAEEMVEVRSAANSRLLLNLLSIVDDLNRAVSLIPDDAVAPGWLEGVQLVQRNIDHILEAEGVSRIDAVGKPFEPWELEAVQYEETPDAEDGRVISVLRDGYKHHDKVLRAAQVIVAKKPEQQDQPENIEEEAQ